MFSIYKKGKPELVCMLTNINNLELFSSELYHNKINRNPINKTDEMVVFNIKEHERLM